MGQTWIARTISTISVYAPQGDTMRPCDQESKRTIGHTLQMDKWTPRPGRGLIYLAYAPPLVFDSFPWLYFAFRILHFTLYTVPDVDASLAVSSRSPSDNLGGQLFHV